MSQKDTGFKTVLYLDLTNLGWEIKRHRDLVEWLGGVGLGLKLLSETAEYQPLVLAIGPLSGLFPYVTKTAAVFADQGKLQQAYGGGSLALMMRLASLDAIVITGRAENEVGVAVTNHQVSFGGDSEVAGLARAGRSSRVSFTGPGEIDGWFSFGDPTLSRLVKERNLSQLIVSGTGEVPVAYPREYQDLFQRILGWESGLAVEAGENPSCAPCPLGCKLSHEGETQKVGVLPRCLVACGWAEAIYREVPLVFSCLSSLGYGYSHADLEKIARKVGELRKTLLTDETEKPSP